MLNRWTGIVSLAAMLAANAALFTRDILPGLMAGAAPTPTILTMESGDRLRRQYTIFDANGAIVGWNWSEAERSVELLTVRVYTIIESVPLPGGIKRQVQIRAEYSYTKDNKLDNLNVQVYGLGVPVALKGEYVPPDEFPCEWQFDDSRGRFSIPAALTRQLSDSIRPFDSLPSLTVGQSWRVELFNPLAGLMANFGEAAISTTQVLVTVVGTQRVLHEGTEIEAFVVECDRVRAWVDEFGEIVRQEVDLPLLGKITLVSQTFDDELKKRKVRESMDRLDE